MNTFKTLVLTLAVAVFCYSETWINYTQENSNIARDYVQCITIDILNNIYIGCDWAGVSKYDGNHWESWTPYNSSYPSHFLEPIDIDSDSEGNLWMCSDGPGLIKFDGTIFTEYDSVRNPRELTVDLEDNIWYRTLQSTVVKYDGTTFTEYDTSDFGSHLFTAALSAGPNGSIWMVADTSLIEFDGNQWFTYDSRSNIPWHQALAFDSLGNVWSGIQNAVAKFDGQVWTSYTFHSDSLRFWFPGALQFDSEGTLWVGYDFGLARFDGSNWTHYTTTNTGQELGWITAIEIDDNNNKWLASFGNGLFVLNEEGVVLDTDIKAETPEDFEILSIYPNPMNPDVTITYSLKIEAVVKLNVFDITGRQVFSQTFDNKSPGGHSFRWSGIDMENNDVSSGVYLIQLSANKSNETSKLLVLR